MLGLAESVEECTSGFWFTGKAWHSRPRSADENVVG